MANVLVNVFSAEHGITQNPLAFAIVISSLELRIFLWNMYKLMWVMQSGFPTAHLIGSFW